MGDTLGWVPSMSETERVIIRPATPDDAESMVAYLRIMSEEPDNQIVTSPGEVTLSVEEERSFITGAAESGNSIFIVADDGGRVVGIASIFGGKRQAARHNGTIGISLHPDYRDRGLGTRMMLWLISWARGAEVLTRLELEVFSGNARAIHLYEKVGFVREGLRRNAFLKYGRYVDSVMMGMMLE
jgi:RimJ/RimL family protein N-acetyltransferase